MRKHCTRLRQTQCLCFRTTDEIGRYYVLIRNTDGTSGHVFLELHGDHLASSGEQPLSKCENYPDQPFGSKHTVGMTDRHRLLCTSLSVRTYSISKRSKSVTLNRHPFVWINPTKSTVSRWTRCSSCTIHSSINSISNMPS